MKTLFSLVLVGALFALSADDAQAQRRGTFGIGGQLGNPTGLALKFGSGSRFDLAAGWDLDDFLFLQGHLLLRERPVPGADAPLTYFYGPGAFFGVRDNDSINDGDLSVGFSFNAGIAYYVDAFEFFGQLTPRLQLIDDTDFDLGGGLGIRYYL